MVDLVLKFPESAYQEFNRIDKLVKAACAVLGLDKPTNFDNLKYSPFLAGLEDIVRPLAEKQVRKDDDSTAWDHITRTADLEETLYVTSFWDAYVGFKQGDKFRYAGFHDIASFVLVDSVLASMLAAMLPLGLAAN